MSINWKSTKTTIATVSSADTKLVGGYWPAFVTAIEDFFNNTPIVKDYQYEINWNLDGGVRSIEKQNSLSPGATNATGGKSPHNYGLAIDFTFTPISDGKKYKQVKITAPFSIVDITVDERIAEVIKALYYSTTLFSGARFTVGEGKDAAADYGHIEFKDWHSIAKTIAPQYWTSTPQINSVSDNEYITQTYVEPYKNTTTGGRSLANDILRLGLKTSDIITQNELQGELTLIRLLENIQSGQQAQVNAVENRLKNFTPLAQQELVVQRLFAIDADEMRNQLASNMYADKNFSTTHAWRAPGKLAVTANLTIPGMSGFRIAQIFWIDRILENYKATGAFQLFGLTEHIDINRGWTTELYARYNVIPRKAMSNIKDSVEYLNLKNLTNKMKNANPSANIKDTSFNPANAPSVTSLGTPIVKNPLTGR